MFALSRLIGRGVFCFRKKILFRRNTMATMRTWTEYNKEIMEELQMVAGKTFDKEQTKKRRIVSATWGGLLIAAAVYLYLKVSAISFIVLPVVLIAVGGVGAIVAIVLIATGKKKKL
jgi:hypothetical protein